MVSLDPASQGNQTLSLFLCVLLFHFKSLRGLNFIAQFHTSLWVILLVATIKGCAINFLAHIHKNPRKPTSRCHLLPWVLKPNDWCLSCQACRWQVCQVSCTSGWLPGPNHHQPGWLKLILPRAYVWDFLLTGSLTLRPFFLQINNSYPKQILRHFHAFSPLLSSLNELKVPIISDFIKSYFLSISLSSRYFLIIPVSHAIFLIDNFPLFQIQNTLAVNHN